MNNMDDVIQEFVCCTQVPPDCRHCPQKGPGNDRGEKCRANVKVDVYHALKAYRDCIRRKERKVKAEVEIEGGGWNWWYVCEECHGQVDTKDKICPHCKSPLDWNGRTL